MLVGAVACSLVLAGADSAGAAPVVRAAVAAALALGDHRLERSPARSSAAPERRRTRAATLRATPAAPVRLGRPRDRRRDARCTSASESATGTALAARVLEPLDRARQQPRRDARPGPAGRRGPYLTPADGRVVNDPRSPYDYARRRLASSTCRRAVASRPRRDSGRLAALSGSRSRIGFASDARGIYPDGWTGRRQRRTSASPGRRAGRVR